MKRYEYLLTVIIALAAVIALVGCLSDMMAPVPPGEFPIQALGPRPHVPYQTHLYTEVITDTWYILVDLSDTTNYPHAQTNSVILKEQHLAGDLSAAVHWQIQIGVVTELDATDGTIEFFHSAARVRSGQFFQAWDMPEHGLNLLIASDAPQFFITTEMTTSVAITSTAMISSALPASAGGYPAVGDVVLFLDADDEHSTLHLSVDTLYDTE